MLSLASRGRERHGAVLRVKAIGFQGVSDVCAAGASVWLLRGRARLRNTVVRKSLLGIGGGNPNFVFETEACSAARRQRSAEPLQRFWPPRAPPTRTPFEDRGQVFALRRKFSLFKRFVTYRQDGNGSSGKPSRWRRATAAAAAEAGVPRARDETFIAAPSRPDNRTNNESRPTPPTLTARRPSLCSFPVLASSSHALA